MAALSLCNRLFSTTRLIVRNMNYKDLLIHRSSQGFLALLSMRRFSIDKVGKDTKKGTEPQVDGAKTGDGDENAGPTEEDPYAPFQDDVNPVTREKGGPRGPEPTRYGDWERKGRCIDF